MFCWGWCFLSRLFFSCLIFHLLHFWGICGLLLSLSCDLLFLGLFCSLFISHLDLLLSRWLVCLLLLEEGKDVFVILGDLRKVEDLLVSEPYIIMEVCFERAMNRSCINTGGGQKTHAQQ